MIIAKNINIPLLNPIRARSALAMARREFINADFKCNCNEVVTIYIHSKNVSDLFIANKYRVRESTDKEWIEYFHTCLHPVVRDPFFADRFKKQADKLKKQNE